MADTYLVKWTREGNMRREVSSAYRHPSVIAYDAMTSLIKIKGTSASPKPLRVYEWRGI